MLFSKVDQFYIDNFIPDFYRRKFENQIHNFKSPDTLKISRNFLRGCPVLQYDCKFPKVCHQILDLNIENLNRDALFSCPLCDLGVYKPQTLADVISTIRL